MNIKLILSWVREYYSFFVVLVVVTYFYTQYAERHTKSKETS